MGLVEQDLLLISMHRLFRLSLLSEVKNLMQLSTWTAKKPGRWTCTHNMPLQLQRSCYWLWSWCWKGRLKQNRCYFWRRIGGITTFEEEIGNYYMNKEKRTKIQSFLYSQNDFRHCCRADFYLIRIPRSNYATCSACATSTNAIADAFNLIRLGKANIIVSGGAEAAITPGGVGGFNAMHAISTRNDSPETASRPFSASRWICDGRRWRLPIGRTWTC